MLKSLLRIVLKVFLLVSMISMPVILHAQITVKADNETVRSILKKIEKQSDMTFFYNEALTDLNKKVSVNVKNSSLESTLNQVLKTTGLAFSFQGKTIVLTDKNKIVAEANSLLTDTNLYQQMSGLHNPYGDGKACERIADFIKQL